MMRSTMASKHSGAALIITLLLAVLGFPAQAMDPLISYRSVPLRAPQPSRQLLGQRSVLRLVGGGENNPSEITNVPPATSICVGLGAAYVGLVVVNVLSSMGKLGPDNVELSRRWNTRITPAGWAFSIWGVIFLLQGAGVVSAVLSPQANAIGINALAPAWLLTWFFEVAWQLVFVNAPTSKDPSRSEQLRIFVPAAILLVCGWQSALFGCARLYKAKVAGKWLELGMAINAGWLSAASSIGLALCWDSATGGISQAPVAVPLILAAGIVGEGLMALRIWGASTLGLGYVGAVTWALLAVNKGPSPAPVVKKAALFGVGTLALGVLGTVLRGAKGVQAP
mmetsp:Transcript_70392/g.146629  ORF Transcript_70392/g.146629 Transcript_70392/m.146629 type:complete len:339 (+) Transcript_70392:74-1090(+)